MCKFVNVWAAAQAPVMLKAISVTSSELVTFLYHTISQNVQKKCGNSCVTLTRSVAVTLRDVLCMCESGYIQRITAVEMLMWFDKYCRSIYTYSDTSCHVAVKNLSVYVGIYAIDQPNLVHMKWIKCGHCFVSQLKILGVLFVLLTFYWHINIL